MTTSAPLLTSSPAGAVASRSFSDSIALLVAAVGSSVALVACALAGEPLLFGIAVLLTGATNSVYMLARQAYLTEITPPLFRARAMSTLGGVGRIGVFVGPFLGAAVAHAFGTVGVFWLALAVTMVAGVVVAVVPDVEGARATEGRSDAARVSTWRVLVEHRAVFVQLGIAVLLVGATRAARQVVIGCAAAAVTYGAGRLLGVSLS